MSSESDYLLKRVPSTNTTKQPANAILKVQELWKLAVYYAGRDYVAEFLATFILMVSIIKLCMQLHTIYILSV